MKSIKIYLITLLTTIFQLTCASQAPLAYEIVPFDYANATMRNQLCAMLASDPEMSIRLNETSETLQNFLSQPDESENKTKVSVIQLYDEERTIAGFMMHSHYEKIYVSKHPETGLWFSHRPQQEPEYQLQEVMESVGYIAELAVAKKFRGQGFATQLLHHLEQDCHSRGLQLLYLFVDVDNISAIKAYEKFGFAIDFMRNDNETSYTMIKKIR